MLDAGGGRVPRLLMQTTDTGEVEGRRAVVLKVERRVVEALLSNTSSTSSRVVVVGGAVAHSLTAQVHPILSAEI